MRKKRERLLRAEEFYKLENLTGGTETSPDDGKKAAEEAERVIEGFEARDKIIFKLSVCYKKTHRDIARFMNIPVNTVSTVIARKKKALKKKLCIFERKAG